MRRAISLGAVLLFTLQLASCGAFKRCAYEGFGRRDGWQEPARVIETLELSPGDRVADLGAGGGYFTFRLADAVGPEGVVYAVDVDASMNEHIAGEASKRGYANVKTILAAYDDPKLPEALDLVFTSNTYHHLQDRVAYWRRVREALPKGARVAILDYDSAGWLRSHYTEKDTILTEMQQAGFTLAADHPFISKQSFLVFAP